MNGLIRLFFPFLFLLLLNGGADDAFESFGANLQAKKKCSVDFENKNYTVITSNCSGPPYPADKCCGSLKEFACPFVEIINDLQSDCAEVMYSHINFYGKYPPGLFDRICGEDGKGIDCYTQPQLFLQGSHAGATRSPSTLLMISAASLVSFIIVQKVQM